MDNIVKPLKIIVPVLILILAFIFIMDKTSPSNIEESAENKIAQEQDNAPTETSDPADQTDPAITVAEDVEELLIEDITVGTGEEVKKGDKVKVQYLGTLLDGTKFDSSYDRDEPFEFTVGEGQVIEGWEQGLLGMKLGGKRKLTIPSKLGYGQTGAGDKIGPNAGLIFEIELLEII